METFDYFQITILVLFYTIFFGRTLQMVMRGANPLVLGFGKKGLERILEISFVVGLAGWTMEIVSHSLHLGPHIFPSFFCDQMFEVTFLRALGAVIIVLGLTLFALSLISFGNSWRIGIDTRNAGDLVTTGAFSLTRNPIFLFLDLYFVGVWLIYPSLFFGIFAVVSIAGIHRQILEEEKFLAGEYGEAYGKYREMAPRYLWRSAGSIGTPN